MTNTGIECILGTVTSKAANFIKKNAENAAKEKAGSQQGKEQVVLQKHRWVPVTLLKRESLSEDTRAYTFSLPDDKKILGLGTCQHVQLGFHMKDKMLIRSYTPTKPLLPAPNTNDTASRNTNGIGAEKDVQDGNGTFELTIKTYFPTPDQPGGAMSNILDCLPLQSVVEIRGPTGEIIYLGNNKFTIESKPKTFRRVNLVLGGSGITPGYSLLARVALTKDDDTEIRVVDANKCETDILLRGELEGFVRESGGKVRVEHILSHPGDGWEGKKGHVDASLLKEVLFEPGEGTGTFLCGPPGMIQKAALPALKGEILLCDAFFLLWKCGILLMLSRLGVCGGGESVWILRCVDCEVRLGYLLCSGLSGKLVLPSHGY